MRKIELTTAFKKDFKREKKGLHKATLDALLAWVVTELAESRPLPVLTLRLASIGSAAEVAFALSVGLVPGPTSVRPLREE